MVREDVMKLLSAVGIVLAATWVLTPASAQEPPGWRLPDFTATEAIESLGGRIPTSKIYHAESKFRVEPTPGFATIYLPAVNRIYRIFSTDQPNSICISEDMNKAATLRSPIQDLSGVKLERTDAGTEVVDGHRCKVWSVTVTTSDGAVGRGRVWEAQDLDGFPIKVEWRTGQRLTAVYREIVLAPPDPALFEPPANCIPIEKAGEVVEEQPPPPEH